MVAVIEAAGLQPIREYIRMRKVTIAENMDCRPTYELYIKAERRPWTTRR